MGSHRSKHVFIDRQISAEPKIINERCIVRVELISHRDVTIQFYDLVGSLVHSQNLGRLAIDVDCMIKRIDDEMYQLISGSVTCVIWNTRTGVCKTVTERLNTNTPNKQDILAIVNRYQFWNDLDYEYLYDRVWRSDASDSWIILCKSASVGTQYYVCLFDQQTLTKTYLLIDASSACTDDPQNKWIDHVHCQLVGDHLAVWSTGVSRTANATIYDLLNKTSSNITLTDIHIGTSITSSRSFIVGLV